MATTSRWGGAGVTAAVVGAVLTTLGSVALFWMTHSPNMSGTISDVQMSISSPCCTFSVQVKLEGFQGHPCDLSWILVNTETGSAEMDGLSLAFEAEADSDQARGDVEVPVLAAGIYIVRLLLEDPEGVELDRVDTEEFEVR